MNNNNNNHNTMNSIQSSKKSWHIGRFLIFGLSLLPLLAGCEKSEVITPGDTGGGSDSPHKEIIYSVGATESRQTLTTEAEWDALLDRLCDQAQNGNEVTFYNISQTSHIQVGAKGVTKDNRTISTTDRDEIKSWMKEMERQGLTVQVTYDAGTGTWNGVAYATLPADNTSGILIGTWHFNCMVVTRVGLDGELLGSDLYEPEVGLWYYTFGGDGTVTLTKVGMEGTATTDSSTWSLSEDGMLCSDLLPSGAYWNVNWITPQTLIMSSATLGTEEGDLYYQLQFDAVTE